MNVAWETPFIIQTCCIEGCGIVFGVPKKWDLCRRNDHAFFYCPNGHAQKYTSESEEKRLKAALARAEHYAKFFRDQRDQTREAKKAVERQLAATKGVVTRVKRRVAHGVCPVDGCKRHFNNLDTHIAKQHPGYNKEAPPP